MDIVGTMTHIAEESIENFWLKWQTENDIKKSLLDLIELVSNRTSILVMLSGWIDSTALLYLVKALWSTNIVWLEFFYDWKPRHESELITTIASLVWIEYSKVNYPSISLSDWNKGEFNESNSFYYSIAASLAYKMKIKYILSGQILNDWINSTSKEATPHFYKFLNEMLRLEYWVNAPQVLTPFIYLNKKQVVDIWKKLWVPFEYTRSCIEDQYTPCWKCEQCFDRENALKSSTIYS